MLDTRAARGRQPGPSPVGVVIADPGLLQPAVIDDLRAAPGELHQGFGHDRMGLLPQVNVSLRDVAVPIGPRCGRGGGGPGPARRPGFSRGSPGYRLPGREPGLPRPASSLLRKERTVRQSYPARSRRSSSRCRSARRLASCHKAIGTAVSIGLSVEPAPGRCSGRAQQRWHGDSRPELRVHWRGRTSPISVTAITLPVAMSASSARRTRSR